MNELEAAMKAWLKEKDLWKSDESDWEDIWADLAHDHGRTPREVAELIDRIMGLTKAEYGA